MNIMQVDNIGLEIIEHFFECNYNIPFADKTFECLYFANKSGFEIDLWCIVLSVRYVNILGVCHGEHFHIVSGFKEEIPGADSNNAGSASRVEKFADN